MIFTWPVDRTCLPAMESDDAPEDVLRYQEAVDTAVMVLWSLTGRQFAVSTTTARPCPGYGDTEDYAQTLPGLTGFVPILDNGAWRNVPGCGVSCTPEGMGVVLLPGPVASVERVEIDGVDIDLTSFALEGDRLYRTAGGSFPAQDMSRPLGEPGTWAVHYTIGVAPPAGAALMVGTLAKEFLAVCSGKTCRLPRRWQSVSRQGVTIQRADPTDILAQGYVGIPEIDTWIRALNPHRLSAPPAVASPDFNSRPGVI